jgi:hypothetical protein
MNQEELLEIIEKAASEKSTSLDLIGRGITSIPPEIGKLKNLTELKLFTNRLTSIPAELGQLTKLESLLLSDNKLTRIPSELGQLNHLKELWLHDNQLKSIPAELGQLTNLTELSLYTNQLTSIPAELGKLNKLEILSLHYNQLTSIPAELGNLTNLTELHLYNNQLTSIPTELGQLTKLKSLTLHNNDKLTSPPPEVVKQGTKSILVYLREQMKDHTTARRKSISDRKKEKDKIGTVNVTIDPKEVVPEFEKRLDCKLGRNSRRIIQEAWKLANEATPKSPRFTTGWLLLAIVVYGKRTRIRNTAKFLYESVKEKEREVRESYRNAVRKEGFVSEFNTTYVSNTMKMATQIAIETTGNSIISLRHLFAGLLLCEPDRREGAPGRLREMGADIDELRVEFLSFLKEAKLKDDTETWTRILKGQIELEEIGEEGTSSVVAFLPSHISDQASIEDLLGFEPYVKAIADFLRHPDTKPPLTLSIEGEWGCGKSSFMLQLEKEICGGKTGKDNLLRQLAVKVRSIMIKPICFIRLPQQIIGQIKKANQYLVKWMERPRRCEEYTVRFNAWRHDKEDAVWAAFALEFLKQISQQRCWLGRLVGYVRLCQSRYDWKEGFLPAVRFFAAWLFLVSLSLSILIVMWAEGPNVVRTFAEGLTKSILGQSILEVIFGGGSIAAWLTGVGLVLSQAKNYIGNPLSIELRKYIQSPDYKNRVSFIEQFHKDFTKIVCAYAGKKKVYVFIDDVDRCEVPKASDLMQSLNLLIANDPQLIFIIGMDREKVAAGLAVKFKELLPYLSGFDRYSDGSQVVSKSPLFGLEYGYNFIEKFIQIPFLVPRPDEKNLRKLLDQIGKSSTVNKPLAEEESAKIDSPIDMTKPDIEDQVNAEHEREEIGHSGESHDAKQEESGEDVEEQVKREEARVAFDRDFDRIRDIVQKVNPALESNPRRVKQFINLFRLRAYIAIETGFIDLDKREPSIKDWTFEKLGKLIAISLRWPLLLAELDKDPTILLEIEQSAWKPDVKEKLMKAAGSNLAHWVGKIDMRELLRAGCFDKNGKADPEGRKLYSIGELNLDKLLLVSPKVRDIKPFPLEVSPSPAIAAGETKGPEVVINPEQQKIEKKVEDTGKHEESNETKSVKKAPKKKEIPAQTINKKKAKKKTLKKKVTKKKVKKKLK